MREIKFRAWDKWNEAMVYPKGILSDGRIVEFSCGSLDAWEGYEIMQYTGLKDRNGREIYDGDILRDEFGRISQVYWVDKEARFTIKDRNRKTEYFMLIDHLHVEVIGNIYENPELLKGDE